MMSSDSDSIIRLGPEGEQKAEDMKPVAAPGNPRDEPDINEQRATYHAQPEKGIEKESSEFQF